MRAYNTIPGTLDASAKTVTFASPIEKGRLFTIVNVTKNVLLYRADGANLGLGGSLNVGGDVLTLTFDTTSHADSDELQVLYEGQQSEELAQEVTVSTLAKENGGFLQYIAAVLDALTLIENDSKTYLGVLSGKDYATQSTLAQVLSALQGALTIGLPTGAATEATLLQNVAETQNVGTILGNLYAGTTIAQLHARLEEIRDNLGEAVAVPDANTVQDRLKTLATALTSLQAAVATASNQTTGNGLLADILAELRDDVFVTAELWVDRSTDPDEYYRLERKVSQDDGSITTTITKLSDNSVVLSLPAGSVPAASDDNRRIEYLRWRANTSNVLLGYTINDWLIETLIIDIESSTTISSYWYNATTGSSMGVPPVASEVSSPDTDLLEAIRVLITTSNVYLQAIQTDLSTFKGNFGEQNATAATTDTENTSFMAHAKRANQHQTTTHDRLGSLTETAPGTDTASSGLNGRLQRVAQRLTSLIALLPTSLTGSGNLKVALQEAIPAGTAEIGKMFVSHQTTKAWTNASVSASSSGENTLVSGTSSQTIRVFEICLVASAAVSIKFKNAASGTDLTGAMPLVANQCLYLRSENGEPLFVTASAGAFILNLSGAVSVTGWIQYTKS